MTGTGRSVLFVRPDAGWLEEHIEASLVDYGCSVRTLIYGEGMDVGMGLPGDSRWRAERLRCNRELVCLGKEMCASGGLDLILFVAYDEFFTGSTLGQLKSLPCRLVNYHVDLPSQWYRVLRTAGFFDLLAVAHRKYSDELARKGANILFLPMAARPPVDEVAAAAQEPRRQAVSFIGFMTPFRSKVIRHLAGSGIPLEVYGPGWTDERHRGVRVSRHPYKYADDAAHYLLPRLQVEGSAFLARKARVWLEGRVGGRTAPLPANMVHGGIPADEVSAYYRGNSINLGIDGWALEKAGRVDWGQVRHRDFEIPMAGGFLLAQAVSELDLHFRYGEEVAVWRDLDELTEKAKFYLDNPEEAETIRAKGHSRALGEHKWSDRWGRLFERLSGMDGR